MTDAARVPHGTALYLAVVQFFFVSTWTVYVIFLPGLVETAGIPKSYVIWILMLDQAIFAVMDLVLGRAADLVRRELGRVGPFLLGLCAMSCLAFLLLPHAVRLPGGSVLALVCIVVWVATASVLRAPPWLLLSRYAASPSMPLLAALNLTGLAIGGAIAPYLTLVLKGLDPALPFAVTSIVLLVTTAGLVKVERAITQDGTRESTPSAPRAFEGPVALFFCAMAVAGFGFQIHSFVNSAPLYLRYAASADLPWLLPIFWVGFSAAMFPASSLAKRFGPLPVVAAAALAGCIGLVIAQVGTTLEWTIVGQIVAGSAWGSVSAASFTAVSRFGHSGREGFMIGALWSALSLAALLRMACIATDLHGALGDALAWMPVLLWAIAGALVLTAYRSLRAPA